MADRFIGLLNTSCRHIALLAAWIATCGSLFFSEALHWPPCLLCWYQRILMYPLAIILIVGIFRDDRRLHSYVLPFSLLGIATSLYHYLIIRLPPGTLPTPPCSALPGAVPCTVDPFLNWFGFINIPFLALSAFFIITVMMLHFMLLSREEDVQVTSARPPDAAASSAQIGVLVIVALVVFTFIGAGAFVKVEF